MGTTLTVASASCRTIKLSPPTLALAAALVSTQPTTVTAQSISPKVIGGEDVAVQQNPWQVSLSSTKARDAKEGHFCGGALVHPEWVLTAAHCVDDKRPQDLRVLGGASSLQSPMQASAVRQIIVHEGWKPDRYLNDIALVRVAPRWSGSSVATIAGPPPELGLFLNFMPVRVTGWGINRPGVRESATNLQGVELPVVPAETCGNPVAYRGVITDAHLCLGTDAGTQAACNGDSGGPASVDFNGQRRLVGLTSFGLKTCIGPQGYSVFTRVARYVDWVTEKTGRMVNWR